MANLPSQADLFRIARDEVLSRNARISRDAVERDGMDANILIAAASAMADECVGQIADLCSSRVLDSAVETDLDRLVFDRYGLTRKAAAASLGSVQFSTTLPAPGNFNIPTGIIVQTGGGNQFVTVESTVFAVGSTGPLTVAVRSALAGALQNVKIGTITSIVTAIPLAASDLKITNTLATAGGDDAETDASLRDRARRFFSTARRGTMAALEAAALGIPGVRKASAFEVLDALGRPARFCQLVVTDAYTEAFADYATIPPRYQTQSQFLTSQIVSVLTDVRPAGVYVQPVVANVVLQPVQLSLAFLAGSDVSTSALQARAAMVNYINGLSPGDTLDTLAMSAALKTVPGLSYTGREIVSPAGNVLAKPLQVIRTSLSLVSALAAQTNTPIITGTNPDAFSLVP
jgi:uncharacterized phage protein gp47/JayE